MDDSPCDTCKVNRTMRPTVCSEPCDGLNEYLSQFAKEPAQELKDPCVEFNLDCNGIADKETTPCHDAFEYLKQKAALKKRREVIDEKSPKDPDSKPSILSRAQTMLDETRQASMETQ